MAILNNEQFGSTSLGMTQQDYKVWQGRSQAVRRPGRPASIRLTPPFNEE